MLKTIPKTVYVVHCIDVEGPMEESVAVTWERLFEEDGVRMPVPPTAENLARLQDGKLDLGVDERKMAWLQGKYGRYNLSYLTDWAAIDRSIRNATSEKFRHAYRDSAGGPYTFSWFIYDHYGFTTNPRFHDDGIHHIFDHYRGLFDGGAPSNDGIYWHYHHPPSSGDAVEWCTNWTMHGVHEEILARRILERGWFPSVFRAGGHIERNDLSHWLEMFIPFDFSARTLHGMDYEAFRGDVCDWRFAPEEWGAWHPDWYDYRRPGAMRRWLFRCLDMKTWLVSLTARDVREAFEQAQSRGTSILGYYNHDYRDMQMDVDHCYPLLREVSAAFPDVEWRFVNALEAARIATGLDEVQAAAFSVDVSGNRLTVHADRALFGPQPFLAIQEDGRFFRDNFTQEGPCEWVYKFRRPDEVEAFGIAGNTAEGATTVTTCHGTLADAARGAGRMKTMTYGVGGNGDARRMTAGLSV